MKTIAEMKTGRCPKCGKTPVPPRVHYAYAWPTSDPKVMEVRHAGEYLKLNGDATEPHCGGVLGTIGWDEVSHPEAATQ